MMKRILAGTIALTLAGAGLAFAQQGNRRRRAMTEAFGRAPRISLR